MAWRRAVRDLLGHGEGIFGIVDGYPDGVPGAPPERLEALERAALAWRWRLRGRAGRLRRTHGDFHPFNVIFAEGTRFTLLDASRGGLGDPADDLVALTVNYAVLRAGPAGSLGAAGSALAPRLGALPRGAPRGPGARRRPRRSWRGGRWCSAARASTPASRSRPAPRSSAWPSGPWTAPAFDPAWAEELFP